MWTKIHSNRDPRDTLFTEINKEFRPWFAKAGSGISVAFKIHPRAFFGGMVFLLLASCVLSFTVFRHPDKPAAAPAKVRVNPVEDGFSRIMKATGQLRETLRLKQTVDSLSAKKQLTPADSLALNNALDRLRNIHPNHK
jgi:hypothetical protein